MVCGVLSKASIRGKNKNTGRREENEPFATDGKASADRIEILQIFDTETGEDINA
jgi:hypothetical protein